MTELRALQNVLEQIEANQRVAAKALDADGRLDHGDGEYAAAWEKTFAMGDGKRASKTDTEELADRLKRIASNSVVLAEATGAKEYQIEGEATSADWSKTLGFEQGRAEE